MQMVQNYRKWRTGDQCAKTEPSPKGRGEALKAETTEPLARRKSGGERSQSVHSTEPPVERQEEDEVAKLIRGKETQEFR